MVAAPSVAQSTKYLEQATLTDVQQIVSDLDGSTEIRDLGSQKVALITFANGIKAFAYLNCDEDACTGLHVFASFTRPEGTSVEEAMRKANAFDYGHDAVSAGLDDDGDYYISRYLILDGGVAYDNLLVNFAVIESLAQSFTES